MEREKAAPFGAAPCSAAAGSSENRGPSFAEVVLQQIIWCERRIVDECVVLRARGEGARLVDRAEVNRHEHERMLGDELGSSSEARGVSRADLGKRILNGLVDSDVHGLLLHMHNSPVGGIAHSNHTTACIVCQ